MRNVTSVDLRFAVRVDERLEAAGVLTLHASSMPGTRRQAATARAALHRRDMKVFAGEQLKSSDNTFSKY